jgi:glycosyltransferase involved in cell wall biosynthesis
MKVGFLVGSISREAGGLFQSMRGLAKAVMSANATVSVLGISDSKSAVDLPKWQPLSVRTFPSDLRAWGYSNQLVPALLDSDLDVLSTHGLWKYGSVASRRWHRRTGRPYVVHPHGMLESWALRNAKWRKRMAALLYENQHLRGAACLCALSEAEAQSIRAYGMRNPICVIPNGIDLPELVGNSKLTGESLAFQTVAESRKILLYLGRLHPKKNLCALLRAWAKIQNSKSEIRNSEPWMLAIAGWDQGRYELQLKRLAHELGVSPLDVRNQRSEVGVQQTASSSVVFLGPRFGTDKEACYRSCDAFILPSLSEGLPMTVLEAWAYAKPVLVTPECNLPEGFVAGAALRIGTSSKEIVAGLKQLTEMSDDDRRAMGAHGHTLVATRFSWPRIGEQMRSVYEWVLDGGTTPETVRYGRRE